MILFLIGGARYFMADIRPACMLTPRELYRANGFPDDYKIDKDYTGKAVRENKASGKVRNAVPPPFACGPGSGKSAGMVRNNNHDHGTAGAAGGRVMERAVKHEYYSHSQGNGNHRPTTRGADGQIISCRHRRGGKARPDGRV
ncbi:MAG: hypothetical protein ACLTQP_01080 [Faecalibacterium prausnitzii]